MKHVASVVACLGAFSELNVPAPLGPTSATISPWNEDWMGMGWDGDGDGMGNDGMGRDEIE